MRQIELKIDYFNGIEVEKFLDWCDRGGPYIPDPDCLDTNGSPIVAFTKNIERDAKVFKFALNSGAREGEILGFKRKAIDYDNRLLWFSAIYDLSAKELAERTKGKNVRCVEFNEVIEEILLPFRDAAPETLIFNIPTRPLWMDAFYLYCNRAGVKSVPFHALRHSFASAMALYTPPCSKRDSRARFAHNDNAICPYRQFGVSRLHGALKFHVPKTSRP